MNTETPTTAVSDHGTAFSLYISVSGRHGGFQPYHLCAAQLYSSEQEATKEPIWSTPETEVIEGTGTEATYDAIFAALAYIKQNGGGQGDTLYLIVNTDKHQLYRVFGEMTLQDRQARGYSKLSHPATLARIDKATLELGLTLSCRTPDPFNTEEYERFIAAKNEAVYRRKAYKDAMEGPDVGNAFTNRAPNA